MTATTALFRGFARVIPDVPTFVTPVFLDSDGKSVIQQVDESKVTGFDCTELGMEFVSVNCNLTVAIGASPLYGFEYPIGAFTLATARPLLRFLDDSFVGSIETNAAIRRFAEDLGSQPIGDESDDVVVSIRPRSNTNDGASLKDADSVNPLLAVSSNAPHHHTQVRDSFHLAWQTLKGILKLTSKTTPSISAVGRIVDPSEETPEIDVADILGRNSIPPIDTLLRASVARKVVMVTGAGGAIGSEISRQVLLLGPARVVLYDWSEMALHSIERELRAIAEKNNFLVEIVALLGNAHHSHRLRDAMRIYGVQTLYHAAGYKSVQMTEQNVSEGVYNNVFSALSTAECAIETGVETFVYVSTDKAVNPVSVMGASMRLAEMVLLALQERSPSTTFCMVRFGNVMDSSGSVVQLFREQIRRGGPVTVTHPEIFRYFIRISEAAQLVIQAGAMAEGGDVFVLDMGKPVRIYDLARRMIHLMGRTLHDDSNPSGDIVIQFTGLRPGEKLYEELLIGNNVTGTGHPMILRAIEAFLDWNILSRNLEYLHSAVTGKLGHDGDDVIRILGEVVAEYRPTSLSADHVSTAKRLRRTELKSHGAGAAIAVLGAKKTL